ncbi:MAG: HDOD domain-containing protein [Gammaproteobacteria bacterium SHHR-1]|uniref:HDOD domain-containing protein n=1 Tax=Magnetovirga frankeli TaxID=947516 RepID=UPI001292FFB5|nr:HDOD domain-containing protein [gamma proteobacterium SS-5]
MNRVQDLDQASIDRLLTGIHIPPRPRVLVEILQQKQASEPDMAKISEAISTDVALSASILKTVNSSLYGLRNPVNSIPHGVSLLGYKNVISLVTGLSLRQAMNGTPRVSFDRFWDAASNTAMAARALSWQFSVGDPADAYLIGLFHDCGIPLMMMRFHGYVPVIKQASADPGNDVNRIEEQAFALSHSILGYLVAQSWNLPELVCEVIRLHHEPIGLEGEHAKLTPLVYLLAFAEHLGNRVSSLSLDVSWRRSKTDILNFFELDERDYQWLSRDIEDQLLAH